MKLLDISPLTGEAIYFYKHAEDLNANEVQLVTRGSSFWAVSLSWIVIFSNDSGFFGVSYSHILIFLFTWLSSYLNYE